jgi:hypothetical protein
MAGAPSVSRDDLPITKQLFPCQTSHFFPTLLGKKAGRPRRRRAQLLAFDKFRL